jgi:DNA-binding NtrC family response regulator
MVRDPTILVVDDDVNILSAFSDFLKQERCTMIAATNADDALKHLAAHHIDLVITDVRLKYQSGVTLCIRIKQLQPELPVIVITGHPNLLTEKDVKIYGADFYFLKPLELDLLRDAVRKCLHRPVRSSGKQN